MFNYPINIYPTKFLLGRKHRNVRYVPRPWDCSSVISKVRFFSEANISVTPVQLTGNLFLGTNHLELVCAREGEFRDPKGDLNKVLLPPLHESGRGQKK